MISYVRARYTLAGGHVHVRVFSGANPEGAFGKCGDLCFRLEEWPSIVTGLLRANWELVDETPTVDSSRG